MISRLRGILDSKTPPFLLIDVNGVGYELQAPMSSIYQLPDCGQAVTLLTHHYVREDAQVLYGFCTEQERALFRSLIKISGVGPKMALTILSGMEWEAFVLCVERRDTAPLVRLPGVGKKTAERLLIEMAGKLTSQFAEEDFSSKILIKNSQSGKVTVAAAYEEAVSALIALGYKPQEASRAISKVHELEEELSSQELIRRALQGMAKV
jgi:Holliday junction DNA helicase RuvA